MKYWLEDIYREHRRGLFGLALSVVGEATAAEDAVHEAFIRMAKLAQAPSGDPAAYAYKAVRNAAIDQTRRRNARPIPTGDEASLFVTSREQDPGHAAEMNETQQMLMNAVDNLPNAEREVVVMRSFGQLTLKQIAEATDQPLSTVASQHQRALGRLREVMEGNHATI